MKSAHIRWVVLLGTVAIAGILLFQLYFIWKTWNLNERKFTQSAQIALRKVADDLALLDSIQPSISNPVKQLSPNYFVVESQGNIEPNLLEFYLQKEFRNCNLNLDFEYGIYNCHTDKMIYGDYVEASGSANVIKTKKTLPKYEQYVYYFGVNFPTQKSYLIGKLSIWIIFSGLLLMVMIFFTYSLYVILKQKRLSELQKDFIDNMAHEFKTPISSILISSEVLSKPDICNQPERLLTYANIIGAETRRLNEQLEKILQITRIDKKGFDLQKEEMGLHALILPIVQSFQSLNKDFEISCKLEAEHDKIFADKIHFTNIIINLIDNAIKYSSSNKTITVSTSEVPKFLVLAIRDSGIGVAPKHLNKIFNKFYRISDVKPNNGGLGLGLYYVKNVCKKHGWQITVESEPEQYTIFKIFIPLK
jgi:two-component system, OmpR family, phosphate regulon sensor histidine kinase PhoR